MGNIAQIKGGAGELPAELEELHGGRWRLTRRLPLAGVGVVDDKLFGKLGDALAVEYKTRPDEARFVNLRLLRQGAGSDVVNRASAVVLTKVYETLTDEWAQEAPDVADYELNGLERVTRTLVALPGTSAAAWVVGQDDPADTTRKLARKRVEKGDAMWRLTLEFTQSGILEAAKRFDEQTGLLYVTFRSLGTKFTPTALKAGASLTDDPSVAFQGGAAATVLYDRIGNVKGLRTYDVTVMLMADGSVLSAEEDNELRSWQRYVPYTRPGVISIDAGGVYAEPGNNRWLLVQVVETLSASGDLPSGFKPYSVKSWARINVNYIPADGSAPVVESRGAQGYLSNASSAGSNVTFAGVPVDVYAASAGSDPSPTAWAALEDQVVESDNDPAIITDAGQRWYRRRKVTAVGEFSQLNT